MHAISKLSLTEVVCSTLLPILILLQLSARAAQAQGSSLFIYPLKNQTSQQQDKDRYDCHTWAVQQTGYDPSRAYPSNPNYLDPQPYRPSQPHVLKGTGGALGAVGGAITGNAGKGPLGPRWEVWPAAFAGWMKSANRRLSNSEMRQQPRPRSKQTTLGRCLPAWKAAATV